MVDKMLADEIVLMLEELLDIEVLPWQREILRSIDRNPPKTNIELHNRKELIKEAYDPARQIKRTGS